MVPSWYRCVMVMLCMRQRCIPSRPLVVAGEPANITIPSNIAPGNYLLRSELISLQLAVSVGGAEFYPACIQLSIGGSGTGAPQSSEVCKFPGCYSDTDPGIYDPNASAIFQVSS